MAFSRDPVLAVWQAMKPLAEIGARTDASDIAKIVTEAEIILFGLVRALSRRLENSGSTSVTARNQVHSGTLVAAKIVPAITDVCRRQAAHW